MFDLDMMVKSGGRERRAADQRTLITRVGFARERIIPTVTEAAVIEAVAF